MGNLSSIAIDLAAKRHLRGHVALVLAALYLVIWYLAWPGRQIARLWKQRRKMWALLDVYLGEWRPWRRFNSWRRLRMVARCDRKRHTIQGTVLPSGKPGKMCATCGYVQEISPKDFKKAFGISYVTALARANRRRALTAAEMMKGRQAVGR